MKYLAGIETEYGIMADPDNPDDTIEPEALGRLLLAPADPVHHGTNLFLPNGGRLYLDVGAHPEYATAECRKLWDLLNQDRAGAEMLAQLQTEALEQTGKRIHIFRNNIDSAGNSFGCHENYLVKRAQGFGAKAGDLVSFLVTRQILVGAGAIKKQPDGTPYYAYSARSDYMSEALSAGTTRSRPIINTRDEPLADSTQYRRLHVIVGDSNMAEASTLLKVSSMVLVLLAQSRGMRLDDLQLEDPLVAIRQINNAQEETPTVRLRDGRLVRATEIQTEILSRTLRYIDVAADFGDEAELFFYAINLWERAIWAVHNRDWGGVRTELDFAVKWEVIDAYLARHGEKPRLDDARVSRLLLSYHAVGSGGLRRRLEQSGLMRRLTSQEAVITAIDEPPSTTRARVRGALVAASRREALRAQVEWSNVKVDNGRLEIQLPDPFNTDLAPVNKFERYLEGRNG